MKIKKRSLFALLTIILLLIEIYIGLYVHDNFVRPYIGDLLVVVVFYLFLRIWIPKKRCYLSLLVFAFAVFTEWLQSVRIVELLGLQNNAFSKVLIGCVFDWTDIICYGIGCIFCLLIDFNINHNSNSST